MRKFGSIGFQLQMKVEKRRKRPEKGIEEYNKVLETEEVL